MRSRSADVRRSRRRTLQPRFWPGIGGAPLPAASAEASPRRPPKLGEGGWARNSHAPSLDIEERQLARSKTCQCGITRRTSALQLEVVGVFQTQILFGVA